MFARIGAWRNWQARVPQEYVEQSVRVRIPPPRPTNARSQSEATLRNYTVMRNVLMIATGQSRTFGDFMSVEPKADALQELSRLVEDGLIAGDVELDRFGACRVCEVSGLTNEGVRFWRLIENDEVWKIVLSTLGAANVDVSYPLLKEVCEEIVKRYVTQFIPSDLRG